MNKTFKTGIAFAFMIATSVNTASAQFSLKKLAKSAVSAATSSGESTEASTTTENKINKEDFHKFEARKVYVVDENGARVKSEVGTDVCEVKIFDTTTGEIVDETKLAAQTKAINKAILAIAAKAAVGAGIGALSGGGSGALAGLAAGIGLSIDDIKTIISVKKDINKQNKLMEAYNKCYNEEGQQTVAELSKDDKKALGDLDKNTCEMTSAKLNEAKEAAKTANTSNSSIDNLLAVDLSKL